MFYNNDIIEEMIVEGFEFPEKDNTRSIRRKRDYAKASRKEHIANLIGYHAPKGTLKKGKVHCSCPLCRAKTNRHAMRLSSISSHRYGDNYKPSDCKKIDKMRNQIFDFLLEV